MDQRTNQWTNGATNRQTGLKKSFTSSNHSVDDTRTILGDLGMFEVEIEDS